MKERENMRKQKSLTEKEINELSKSQFRFRIVAEIFIYENFFCLKI